MTACLRNFQETIKSNDDNWDAYFGARHTACGASFELATRNYKLTHRAGMSAGDAWTSADMVSTHVYAVVLANYCAALEQREA